MWVLFYSFSCFLDNLYQLSLHNEPHVALATLQRSIGRNQIEHWTCLDLVVVIGIACLLTTYIGLLVVFTAKCEVVKKVWGQSQVSFERVSLW